MTQGGAAEAVSSPPPRPDRTRWVEMAIAGSAILISIASLFVAIQQSRVMEDTVAAQTWPNVQISVNATLPGTDGANLSISVHNNGVGPARIESVELFDGRRPLADLSSIARMLGKEAGGRRVRAKVDGSVIAGTVLGAGESSQMLSLTTDHPEIWNAPVLNAVDRIESRTCFCSVLDRCFIADSRIDRGRSRPVSQCLAVAIPFDDRLEKQLSAPVAAARPQP